MDSNTNTHRCLVLKVTAAKLQIFLQEARNSIPGQGRPSVMKASTQQGSVVVPGQVCVRAFFIIHSYFGSCVIDDSSSLMSTFVQEPLTTAMLAAAPMQEQKQMLGERIFPLIQVLKSDSSVNFLMTEFETALIYLCFVDCLPSILERFSTR